MQYVNKEIGLIVPMVAKIEWMAKVDKEANITINEDSDMLMKPNQIKVHWRTAVKFIKNVYSISGEKFEAETHVYDAFSNSENFFDSVVFTERKKKEALQESIKTLNKAFYARNNTDDAISEMENSWDDDSEPEVITNLKAKREKAVAFISKTLPRIHALAEQYSSIGEEVSISQLREDFWDTEIEKFYNRLFEKDVYEEIPGIDSTDDVTTDYPKDTHLTEEEEVSYEGNVEGTDTVVIMEEEDDEFGPIEKDVTDPEESEDLEVRLTPSEAEEALGEL